MRRTWTVSPATWTQYGHVDSPWPAIGVDRKEVPRKPWQAQPVELEDAFEMREQHLYGANGPARTAPSASAATIRP